MVNMSIPSIRPAVMHLRESFYYTTYENRQITAVRMRPDMLERDQLIRYPMQHQEKIAYEN